MSTLIPLSEAEGKLGELIARLSPGDEVVLTRDDVPGARLLPSPATVTPAAPKSGYGAGRGRIVIHDDGNDYLKDFEEYGPAIRPICPSPERERREGRPPVARAPGWDTDHRDPV